MAPRGQHGPPGGGWRVGIEVGGTFTDRVAIGPGGLGTAKVPSVPSAPDEGLFAALAAADLPLSAIEDLIHGSTVATNAVLERRGARIALLVTEGFRDVILIGRSDRPRIFDLAFQRPVPLLRRRDIFEVPERMAADGSVLRALDAAALEAPLRRFLQAQAYDALAVCLINGFGASKSSDGADGISGLLSNSHNQPIESLDLGYSHFRVAAYGLHEGSGGDGEHRGGLGFLRKYEILEDNVIFSLYADRFALSNRGAFGGAPGGRARCEIRRGDEVIQVPCKHSTTLRKGDLLCLYTGGGGGYGAPAARPAAGRARARPGRGLRPRSVNCHRFFLHDTRRLRREGEQGESRNR